MYFLRAFMSRFITRFHWTFLTEINLITYLLYMFIYTYISNTNECWILKMLNISVIWYLLFTMYSFLLISLHLYYMYTLSTVFFFNYLKDMALYISIKITDKFYLKSPSTLHVIDLYTDYDRKMSTKMCTGLYA